MNIAIKCLICILTSGLVGGVSVFLLGFMLVAMNGYSESDANYGIILFVVWACIGSLLAGLLSVLTSRLLVNKMQFHIALAGLVAIIIFVIVGVIINFIGVFAGITLSEIIRTQF